MFHPITIPPFSSMLHDTASQMKSMLLQLPRQAFITGPRILLTSRITGKCAALMFLLLTPAILSGLFLSLPPMIFQSPQQNAYFYFANVLERDPSRWLPMGFAVLCILLALAIPASMPRQRVSVSY